MNGAQQSETWRSKQKKGDAPAMKSSAQITVSTTSELK